MNYGGVLMYKPQERQGLNNSHPQEGLNKQRGWGRQFNAFLRSKNILDQLCLLPGGFCQMASVQCEVTLGATQVFRQVTRLWQMALALLVLMLYVWVPTTPPTHTFFLFLISKFHSCTVR